MVTFASPLIFQRGIVGLGIVKVLPLYKNGLYGAKVCYVCPAGAGGWVLEVVPHTLYILWGETHRDSQTCGSLGVEYFGDEGYFPPGSCLAFSMSNGVEKGGSLPVCCLEGLRGSLNGFLAGFLRFADYVLLPVDFYIILDLF